MIRNGEVVQVPIVKGDRIGEDQDYGDVLPKNYIAVAEPYRGANGYLISHNGLTKIMDGAGYDRGAVYNDRVNAQFRLSGSQLLKIVGNQKTELGAITGSGQASMPYSFQSQLVVTNGLVYRVVNDTMTQLTDPGFSGSIDGVWIDNYYFLTDGEYLYHTVVNDETAINPNDYATAEFMPDKSIGLLKTQDNLVAVFGRNSLEYFYNDATEDFAFSRIPQKALKVGIVGTFAKCELDGQIFILGGRKEETPSVHVIGVGSADCISTKTVDKIIASYSQQELSEAVLESRIDIRDKFLIVRLKRHTLLFNYSVAKSIGFKSAWSILTHGVKEDVWLGANGVFDQNLQDWIYGSTFKTGIYKLDETTAAQDGEKTEGEFSTPLVPTDYFRVNKIELNTVSGFNDEDFTVFFSVSRDGAIDGIQWQKLYGQPGDYTTRFICRRVGYFKDEMRLNFRTLSREKANFSNLRVWFS